MFFVDNRYHKKNSARDHQTDRCQVTERRALNDGRMFDIVKVFYEPEGLTERLEGLGWHGDFRLTSNFFIYGTAFIAS